MRFGGIMVGTILFLASPITRADVTVRIGDSDAELHAKLGHPTRVIEANEGRLYFFGSTLVYVTQGAVDFISVGDEVPPHAAAVSIPATASVVPRPKPAPQPALAIPPPPIVTAESLRQLREREERQLRLATRTRRFALTKAYAALHPSFIRALPLIQEGTCLGFKDARGNPLPTVGDNAWSASYGVGVDVRDFVLAQ